MRFAGFLVLLLHTLILFLYISNGQMWKRYSAISIHVDPSRPINESLLAKFNGTNDDGALKQAYVVVVLLNGAPDDLKKITEHQRIEHLTKVYETQL